MNKGDREYMGFGAVIGVLISVLLIAVILIGLYASSAYAQVQAEKEAQAKAIIEARNLFIEQKTWQCNQIGLESYNIDRNICYTEQNIDHSERYKSSYYEEFALG